MPAAQDIHPLAPLLFADTPIDGKERDALGISTFLKFNDREGALRRLKSAIASPASETRTRLIAATTLRAWGYQIPSETVIGVVVEYPVEAGVDYVAAYADGSARYLNYSGKAIIWDTRVDSAIDAAVFSLLKAGQQLFPHAVPAAPWSSPATEPRVTCLTLGGNRVSAPTNADGLPALSGCVAHAGALMGLLIQQTQKQR